MNRMHTAVSLFLLAAGSAFGQPSSAPAGSDTLPVYDHIVIVVEENKNYEQVIGSPWAPYINQVLRAEGANLTRMYGEEHASEGNYFWLFSGSNQAVGYEDQIPGPMTHRVYPFQTGNLGKQLFDRGLTFRGYSEDLPSTGSTVTKAGHYARKHVPWISFGNIPRGTNPDSSTNLRFDPFLFDFSKLPTVAFVIPNLVNDMHDASSQPGGSVRAGDDWLKKYIDPYYQWAKTHNSLLIVTFDECDDPTGYRGPTDPGSPYPDIRNRIPTIFAGAHVKQGDFDEGYGVTHVNILRTIEAIYGLHPSGSQPPNAMRHGITSEYIIRDIFEP